MPQFIKLTESEKNEVFFQTASKMNISPLLVEKDFWVSWVLNEIFKDDISNIITFKGGTSLSKAYGLIDRFSEDIDLTIDKHVYAPDIDLETISGKKFSKHLKDNDEIAINFVGKTFKSKLEEILTRTLGPNGWKVSIESDEQKNLRFYYPSIIQMTESSYVRNSILLEFGIRGDVFPVNNKEVTSYVHKEFKGAFECTTSKIRTLSPERTFWEKITLLHAENHRNQNDFLGDRLSRHYYDVYKLIEKNIADEALKDRELLAAVIDNKKRYFRSSWANYNTAIPGSLIIYPNPILISKLEIDYKNMKSMLFGSIPSFEMILSAILQLENKINSAKE